MISDFVEEAWALRNEAMEEETPNQGFQVVKRKPKRIPLAIGRKDEQKEKGKLQKINNE